MQTETSIQTLKYKRKHEYTTGRFNLIWYWAKTYFGNEIIKKKHLIDEDMNECMPLILVYVLFRWRAYVMDDVFTACMTSPLLDSFSVANGVPFYGQWTIIIATIFFSFKQISLICMPFNCQKHFSLSSIVLLQLHMRIVGLWKPFVVRFIALFVEWQHQHPQLIQQTHICRI